MLSLMFFVYSTKHSAHSENRDQRMRQVVAYKQWKIINPSGPKSGRGRLHEVVVY